MAQVKSIVFSIGCALAMGLGGLCWPALAETPVVEIRGGSGESATTPAPAPRTPTAATSSASPGRYGPLTRRDTLWSIAEKARPSERATIYQTIIAIYDNNPGAFENGNINTLKPGAYIDLPTEADVRAVDRRTAVSRFTQLSTGKPARQTAKAAAAAPAPAKAEPATTATPAATKTAAVTTAAATKAAEAAPAQPSEPLKPATSLKGQAEQQQISELQAALATEREQLARLRTEVDAKQNEITLLREQIGRDEALQQQVADLMRANRELEALRELHQRGLANRPWYQPLGESTTLLSLFLGIPTLLLIALLWALFLRKPQVVAAPSAVTGDAQIADLAKEEANLEGGNSQAVTLPSSAVDLTSEVEAALALDDLDDLLLPENGKKAAAASGNLLARDDSLDLGDIGTTIDLSGGDDSLPDLDDLLGQSKPAPAKPAAPAPAASADDELNLDDLDSLLASFDAEKKPGKAEPEPAAPVQETARPSDAILSDDDLLAALGEADDAAAEAEALQATASLPVEPAEPETSLEELLDLETGATASQAEAEELDLEQLIELGQEQPVLAASETAAEAEFDLEALSAEPEAAAELELSEAAAEAEFDLEALSAEPEAAAELELSEAVAEAEFDLEALSAEPEAAADSLPDLVAQPEDELLETTLASGTRVVDDDLDLDLTQFEGVTADELLRQIEQADASGAEVELLSLTPEAASETAPLAVADAEVEGELAELDEFGSFTEEDAEKFNEERHELQFDGVADFTEESLQAAARKAAASEQAAVSEERSLEEALAALGEEEVDDAFALELDDEEIAANLAALGLDEAAAPAVTAAQPSVEPELEPELDAVDTASRNQQLLAELEALGSVDESLADDRAAMAESLEANLELEPVVADQPEAAQASSPMAPAWDLSPVDGEELLASEVASTADAEPEAVEAPAMVVGAAALADDELSVAALASPVDADFDEQTEQALASLEQPVARRAPLFASDHSDSDRLGEALPPGFHGQSKVQSAFRGFEELLPEVNHIDVDADNGCNAKLDLARAYIEIDDPEGARDILDDVLAEGTVDQRLEAQRLLLLLQRSL